MNVIGRLRPNPFAGEGIAVRRTARPRSAAELTRTLVMTTVILAIAIAFLAPLAQTMLLSLKSQEQVSQLNSPLLPSLPATFDYEGRTYDVYHVPIDGAVRDLALIRKGRQDSDFVDPANPGAGLINWVGAWRTLEQSWTLAPQWQNYSDVWDLIDFPRLLFNTLALAIIGTIGTVISCTLVAYGFARFRFPGRGLLFTLLIATIFLPAAVTLIPTYTIFVKLGWVGTWLPLLVPAFFANAYDVFLMRQYFLTIPRDLDEAAAIDGASPLRILRSVVLPQAWPVIAAVSIFHFVYAWNDYFGPFIYLAGNPDIVPLQVGLARFNGVYYENPAYIHAGTMLTLIIPVVLFLVFQKVFVRGIVITGVEKVTPARIALTFDTEHPDRPHEPGAEGRLLALLERHGIRATFLLQGRWVEAYPELARSIAGAGHLIGNHSHYHVRMPLLTPAGFDTDIRAAEEAIRSLVGVDPRPWFRFPFGAGATEPALHARLETLGYRHLGWDVNVEEWMPGSTADGVTTAITAALDTAPSDAIVLLHAWPTPVVPALEQLVPVIRDRGGSFVGVDELGAGAAVTIPA